MVNKQEKREGEIKSIFFCVEASKCNSCFESHLPLILFIPNKKTRDSPVELKSAQMPTTPVKYLEIEKSI